MAGKKNSSQTPRSTPRNLSVYNELAITVGNDETMTREACVSRKEEDAKQLEDGMEYEVSEQGRQVKEISKEAIRKT